MTDQKKSGIIISYITLIFSSFFSIFFTPFLISSLGVSEYGLYQLVNSFAGYLVVLNFGAGTVITRYVAQYQSLKDDKAQAGFLTMAFSITVVLAVVILLAGYVLYFGIDALFTKTLTIEELVKAKDLYVLMLINIAVSLFSNAFSGIISGYEKFFVSNGLKLVKIIIRVITLVVLLLLGYKSLAIVVTDLSITLLLLLFEALFCFFKLKIKFKYYKIEKTLLWTTISFSFAVFLQSIVNQVNQNVDKVILGAMTDTKTVAMYSIALVFFTMFGNIIGTIGSVFIPQATRMVINGSTKEELTDLVIRPGRLQFMVGGAAVAGFILFGKKFINIWVGSEFSGAYTITLILVVPMIIPLVQNVSNAILDALMKRIIRSVILIIGAGLNIILSIIFVKYIGYIGAAIGTAISVIIGNVIMMNVYLSKYIGLNIPRMLKEIFKGTLPCLLIASAISIPITILINDSIISFLIKSIYFIIIYTILLYKFSMNDSERKLLILPIQKMLKF